MNTGSLALIRPLVASSFGEVTFAFFFLILVAAALVCLLFGATIGYVARTKAGVAIGVTGTVMIIAWVLQGSYYLAAKEVHSTLVVGSIGATAAWLSFLVVAGLTGAVGNGIRRPEPVVYRTVEPIAEPLVLPDIPTEPVWPPPPQHRATPPPPPPPAPAAEPEPEPTVTDMTEIGDLTVEIEVS